MALKTPNVRGLGQADRPLGEVARVDELHGVAAVAGGEHVAPAVEAHRPVGEAVALVAGADDEARAGRSSSSPGTASAPPSRRAP